jgi:hypothetical protein
MGLHSNRRRGSSSTSRPAHMLEFHTLFRIWMRRITCSPPGLTLIGLNRQTKQRQTSTLLCCYVNALFVGSNNNKNKKKRSILSGLICSSLHWSLISNLVSLTNRCQHRYKYTTFSHGIHRCPGRKLALLQIRTVLAVCCSSLSKQPTPPSNHCCRSELCWRYVTHLFVRLVG